MEIQNKLRSFILYKTSTSLCWNILPVRFCQELLMVFSNLTGQVANKDKKTTHCMLFKGFPRPEIRWFHGSEDITKSINYEISYGADGRSVLNILEVFDEDAGSFTCQAYSDLGQASSTAHLVVQSTFAFMHNM